MQESIRVDRREWSASPRTISLDSGNTLEEVDWYKGTILLLHLPPSSDPGSILKLPAFSPSDLTPAFFNRHLKPQLEKIVPESISYINTLTTSSSSQSSDSAIVVAIRTAHPTYAAQLASRFPELSKMNEEGEQRYWSDLPAKVRTAAQNRVIVLDRKLLD